MSDNRCVRCNDETPRDRGALCDHCTGKLTKALGDVAALTQASHEEAPPKLLAAELDVTATRQSRAADNAGRRSAVQPLPFDWDAADLVWALHNTLGTWVRDLAGDHAPLPTDTSPALAEWLLNRIEQIRHHPAAEQIHDEITACVWTVERAVDRRPARWYAGPCGATFTSELHVQTQAEPVAKVESVCTAELYAAVGAETIRCRVCGTDYDVADRRKQLLDAAEDHLAHAELIGQALTSLGQRVAPERLRQWKHRGRLVPRGVDLLGRPTYRVGDVLDLLAEDARLEERRAAKQAQRQERASRGDTPRQASA